MVDFAGGAAARDLPPSLRAAGLRADRAFDGRSPKSQFKAADRSGARLALVVGPDEAAAGTVGIKDLRRRLVAPGLGGTPRPGGGGAPAAGALSAGVPVENSRTCRQNPGQTGCSDYNSEIVDQNGPARQRAVTSPVHGRPVRNQPVSAQ